VYIPSHYCGEALRRPSSSGKSHGDYHKFVAEMTIQEPVSIPFGHFTFLSLLERLSKHLDHRNKAVESLLASWKVKDEDHRSQAGWVQVDQGMREHAAFGIAYAANGRGVGVRSYTCDDDDWWQQSAEWDDTRSGRF